MLKKKPKHFASSIQYKCRFKFILVFYEAVKTKHNMLNPCIQPSSARFLSLTVIGPVLTLRLSFPVNASSHKVVGSC